MRKAVLGVIILACCLHLLPALETYSRSMYISGYYGEYHSIKVFPLHNEAAIESTAGFPFDLLGEDVKESAGIEAGRIIGHWTLHSNHPEVTILFAAEDLKYTGETEYGHEVTIPYILSFYYEYPVYASADATDYTIKHDVIYVGSESLESTETEIKDFVEYNDKYTLKAYDGSNYSIPYGINTGEGYIKFILPEGYDISDDSYPVGTYSASVQLTIEGN